MEERMDLLSIGLAVWRHKLAIIPIIMLTVLAVFYVLVIKPPVYETSSSLLFLNPTGPPTRVSTDNPYSNLGEVWTADAVVSAVAGDFPQVQITLSTNPNNPPIIEISGTGSTAQAAVNITNQATGQAISELYQMQKAQGVNDLYMIKAIELGHPGYSQPTLSGKLRSLIAIFALAAIFLFVAVSISQKMEKNRKGGWISPGRSTGMPPQQVAWPDGRGSPASPAVVAAVPVGVSFVPPDGSDQGTTPSSENPHLRRSSPPSDGAEMRGPAEQARLVAKNSVNVSLLPDGDSTVRPPDTALTSSGPAAGQSVEYSSNATSSQQSSDRRCSRPYADRRWKWPYADRRWKWPYADRRWSWPYKATTVKIVIVAAFIGSVIALLVRII
jgi:capsular polysaccharide biosynthesis protein